MQNKYRFEEFEYKDKGITTETISVNLATGILYAIMLTFLLFAIIYTPFMVEGTSMQPYLNTTGYYKSDIVYINRFAKFTYGDILVLKKGSKADIIKRVIALPGDKLRYEYNEDTGIFDLYLNDEYFFEDYIKEPLTKENLSDTMWKTEEGGDPFLKLKMSPKEKLNFDSEGNYIVGENKVFAMGDNRLNSSDSRNIGAYSYSEVVGRMDFVIKYGTSRVEYLIKFFLGIL